MDVDAMLDRAVSFGALYQVKPPRWTEDEDRFLRDNLTRMTDSQLAAALGRSEAAVHLRTVRDLRLPSRSKQPGCVTGNQAADMLGVEVHVIMRLIARNLLPGGRMVGERGIFVIRKQVLYRWAINPMRWPYFQAWEGRVADPHLRRLIARQLVRWGDEWLTTGQAAAVYGRGIDDTDINRCIRRGIITGVRWGNWWVKKSDILNPLLVIRKGKGSDGYDWNPQADACMLRLRGEGKTYREIGRLMNLDHKQVAYRVSRLKGMAQ